MVVRSMPLEKFRQDYCDAILQGDIDGAGVIIQRAVLQLGVTDLYLDVLAPVQAEIGQMWTDQQVNIAQEHLASQIVLGHLSRLKLSMKPTQLLNRRALVTSVEGDFHTIGARMVADFLYFDGWEVDFLGANTPASSLIRFMQERHIDLIALSVTLDDNLTRTTQAVSALRSRFQDVLIMVGGRAAGKLVETPGIAAAIVTSNAQAAVEEARRLGGFGTKSLTLENYLKTLGTRVKLLRKARGWSQQTLAATAGLDRTYVSSVEHGKQNLTISVALRLADALQVPLEGLLSEAFLETSPHARS